MLEYTVYSSLYTTLFVLKYSVDPSFIKYSHYPAVSKATICEYQSQTGWVQRLVVRRGHGQQHRANSCAYACGALP